MKFFSALGGKKDRSTRSTSRSKSNGRSVVQPEIQNIISNKRAGRAISQARDSNSNGRSVTNNRALSNSVSAESWTNPKIDETDVAQSRNLRFPLSTTSDPWSQATWPEEDDGFFLQPKSQSINQTTEWAVPADLADPWRGRTTDSWDGVGSREHPIAVEEDPLRTREKDILSRQQKQHEHQSVSFAQQVANKSIFGVRYCRKLETLRRSSLFVVSHSFTLFNFSSERLPLSPYLFPIQRNVGFIPRIRLPRKMTTHSQKSRASFRNVPFLQPCKRKSAA